MIAVLMYHSIVPEVSDRFSVSRASFRAQLDVIAAAIGEDSGDTRVMITFDDGLISHYDTVLPELSTRKISGVFFASPGLIGRPGFLGWEHLHDLAAVGMIIGSHTVTHANLALITEEQAFAEMLESRVILEDRLGIAIRDLALPGGFAPRRVRQQAAMAGYSRVFTSQPWLWNGHSVCVPRICMRGGIDQVETRRIITGGKSNYLRRERLKYSVRMAIGPRLYARLYDALCG